MATYNGNRTCSSSNTEPNACLPNYFCDGGLCKECNAKCNRCSSDGSCTKCNVLSTSPDCVINYVNLADYKSFSRLIYAPVTSRITMGFWIFLPAPQKGKSSILITDFLYLTLDIENRVAYCYVYPNLFYKYSAKINLSFDVINAKWFHITCAMSFYHKMFYINSVSNGINNEDLQPLKHSLNYLHNTEIDEEFYFPIYINENEKLKTEFIDFENIEGGAYLKYFTIFSEYLPFTFHYMYFDFKTVTNFPELLYIIPFDQLIYSNSDIHVIGYNKVDNSNQNITLSLSSNAEFNLRGPLNFKELKLPLPNKIYDSADLTNITELLHTKAKYVYDDNKPLLCNDYLIINGNSPSCVDFDPSSGVKYCSDDNTHYTTYPGLNKGTYCEYPCSISRECILNNWARNMIFVEEL